MFSEIISWFSGLENRSEAVARYPWAVCSYCSIHGEGLGPRWNFYFRPASTLLPRFALSPLWTWASVSWPAHFQPPGQPCSQAGLGHMDGPRPRPPLGLMSVLQLLTAQYEHRWHLKGVKGFARDYEGLSYAPEVSARKRIFGGWRGILIISLML